ncbi:ABC transporter permease [Mesotoga prima]|uniref:ABC transporter permease n=1 Tax=Mesotoga prima TaxID=1184387 RepID=UPI002C9F3312|nr:ABC transporter permease [Mesotoga prima]HQC16019.1 ABC transporter permease [Mesotoga prima]
MKENSITYGARQKDSFQNRIRVFMMKYLIVIIFILMVIAFSVVSPSILRVTNLRSIMVQTSMLSIVAFGMTLVIMGGGVDLSIGSIAGVATIFGVTMMVYSGLSAFLGILLGLLIGALIGFFNGLLVSRFNVAPFVATLSTMFIAQGLQFAIRRGESIGYGFPAAYISMGSGRDGFLSIPTPIWIFIVVLAIMVFITEFTSYGRYVRAIGLNQFASKYSGVRVRLITLSTYVIAGILAALSGLILGASQSYIQPYIGDSFLLDSLVVVLLGKAAFAGYASILGTVFGALFLKSLETGMAMLGAPGTVLNISKGVLLLAVLLLSIVQRQSVSRRSALREE